MVDKILKRKGVEPDDPFALGTGKKGPDGVEMVEPFGNGTA